MVLPTSPQSEPLASGQTVSATIVIPCFNEAERLDRSAVLGLADRRATRVVLVDDGSTDATGDLLDELASRHASIRVLHLPVNVGKGEAVRLGLLRALHPDGGGPGPDAVAYFDADFATPVGELWRLVDLLAADDRVVVVAGSRYGGDAGADRRADRRLLGAIYSGLAGRALGITIRDTQCGAKVLRVDARLQRVLQRPFAGRWSFDIELLDRLLGGEGEVPASPAAIVEVPLAAWTDVAGSKLGVAAMGTAFAQVVRLGLRRGWRRRTDRPSRPDVDLVALQAAHPSAPRLAPPVALAD